MGNNTLLHLPLALFLAISGLHIYFGMYDFDFYEKVTKVLLMPILIFYTTLSLPIARSTLLLTALVFSGIGDILLLYSNLSEWYFIGGLLAFLCAHLVYILQLKKWFTFDHNLGSYSSISLILLFVFLMIGILYAYIEALMCLPITVYAFVIGTMMTIALHSQRAKYLNYYILIAFGAFLFVISDSVLALSKFGALNLTTAIRHLIVMTSYCLAQLLLVIGISGRIHLEVIKSNLG